MVTDVVIIQLREENVKTQSALKEAVERRLVREGEVSILRKTIEKASHIPRDTCRNAHTLHRMLKIMQVR